MHHGIDYPVTSWKSSPLLPPFHPSLPTRESITMKHLEDLRGNLRAIIQDLEHKACQEVDRKSATTVLISVDVLMGAYREIFKAELMLDDLYSTPTNRARSAIRLLAELIRQTKNPALENAGLKLAELDALVNAHKF
jgi:hypothetical protein